MAFITGLILIDAPASALNNGESDDIGSRVKAIRVGNRAYPYVSAQSFRYWLRTTLEAKYPDWSASPVYTAGKGKKQQAYTEGDPLQYWDDDMLGYMRAEKSDTVTRVSPLRTGTLVSIAPIQITEDFGVMARFENEEGASGVVLYTHEFYRAILQGLFSLDLNAVGTFTTVNRTGFRNLNDDLRTKAKEQGLAYDDKQKAYRLPIDQRLIRVQTLLRGLGRLEGGAKQTLHYTDVSPAFVIMAVTRGGNHLFGHVVKHDGMGQPVIHEESLDQALRVFESEILSEIYVGRVEGFMDDASETLSKYRLITDHPREVLNKLADDLTDHLDWLE